MVMEKVPIKCTHCGGVYAPSHGLRFRTATHIGSGGAGGFLHFVLCHAFHPHERHEACPHHEEGACHDWHLRWEVSPLHCKACATTAHTGCGAGQRAVQEQIASMRGLRTRPVPEQVQVSVRCVRGMGKSVRACLTDRSAPLVARAIAARPRGTSWRPARLQPRRLWRIAWTSWARRPHLRHDVLVNFVRGS